MIRVAVCSIFRDESLYLREWIEFHLLAGIEKFYLYQNNSDDDYMAVLKPYIEQGIVALIQWPMPKPSQFGAYQHCIDYLHGSDLWVAFIDCDEFLFSPLYLKIGDAVDAICGDKPLGAIGVNWMCFGAGGQQEYDPKPVTERFTWRAFETNPVNQHIKSIIHMNQRIAVGPTPHHFNVERGTFHESGGPLHSPFSGYHSSEILRINHYSSKSRQEWLERSKLGKPDRADMGIDPAWYADRQAMEVDDRDIWKFLPQLKERLAQ